MEERNQPRRPRRDAEQPQQKSESLIYGKNPVTELLKSGSGVDTVLIAEGLAPAVAAYYTALAKEAGATVKRVHPNKLRLMTGTESHQGVAAFASEIEYVTVDDLMAAAKAKGEAPFLVLSDGIEDPHNLGAVMRSALLCGAHGIVIPKRGGASVTPTVIKSSAGAAERLPVARVANIGETIRRLKEQGVFVYCADMDGVPLRKNNLTGPIALVLGSEGIPLCLNAVQTGKVMAGIYRNWDAAAYAELCQKFGLPDKKQYKDYSTGMKMKLCIAVALAHHPKLLLLDEATNGLDPVVRDEVTDLLLDFARDENHSILISSHIVSDLEKLCDTIAFLHKGRLVLCEEKDALREEYALWHGTAAQLTALDAQVYGKRVTPYGAEALVRRDALPAGAELTPVSIEELFVLMVKGECAE